MAYDEGMAEVMRDDLAGLPITERKMFGGLCFLLAGNMVGGLHKGGAMFRVGAGNYETALALPDIGPMRMTGRAMKGMVDCGAEAFADDALRARLTEMAVAHAKSLPAK